MRRTLFTIGYEGAEISQFLDTLAACGVEQVLDIRDIPVSRKRGFSKTALTKALEERHIGYHHFKALGDPKPGRDAMRRGDYQAFLTVFNAHLSTAIAQGALTDAIAQASKRTSVLLCYERSPKQCHRTIVAREMEQAAGFRVRAIGVSPRLQAPDTSQMDMIDLATPVL